MKGKLFCSELLQILIHSIDLIYTVAGWKGAAFSQSSWLLLINNNQSIGHAQWANTLLEFCHVRSLVYILVGRWILIFDIHNALGAATGSVLHFMILLRQKTGLFMESVI